MKPHPLSSHARKHGRRGFALIAVMMMLALLLMLGVGMLSTSSITLRQSGSVAAMAEARANARMALIIAIGELQKHAGPDQRVTARADIKEEPTGGSTLKQPWLTGVWNTEERPSSALGRDLRLRKTKANPSYLISGNERYDVDGSYPADYITPDKPAPVGRDAVEIGSFPLAGQLQPVRAPLVAINSTSVSKGGYAYWLEDEGIKARADLSNPFDKKSTDKMDTFAAGALGQRNRVDWIAKGSSSSNTPGATLESLPKAGDDPLYTKMASWNSLALASSDPTAASADLQLLGADLTVNSRSLLTDMQRGGFRRDLTAAFSPSAPSLQSQVGTTKTFDSELIFPQQGTRNDGENGNNLAYRPGGAPWSVLKDYANYANLVNSKSQVLNVRDWLGNTPVKGVSPTPTYNGRDLNAVSQLYPVVNRVQMLFDVSYENAGGGNYDVVFHLFPVIVLWNPYDQPLRVPKFAVGIRPKISWDSETTKVEPLTYEYKLEPGTFTFVGTPSNLSPTGNPMVSFRLGFHNKNEFEIPAGKAIILSSPRRHVNASDTVSQELVPEFNDGFGLYVKGARIKPTTAGYRPQIEISQGDADGITDADGNYTGQNNDFGSETRIYSQELGFEFVRCNWNIDGNAPTNKASTATKFITCRPGIRNPTAPLTSQTPKWGGILSRKTITNQCQLLATAGTPNAYPLKSLATYNVRSHHSTHIGDAFMGPVQFISRDIPISPTGSTSPILKPQIANSTSNFAFVGGSDDGGTDRCVMFHIPREKEPMLSLAQFSHAHLGRPINRDIHRSSSIGEDLDPTYPIGNSLRPPHCSANQLRAFTTGQWDWSVAHSGQAKNVGSIHRVDASFLYNNSLWDTYYLSGYQSAGANAPGKFLNARLKSSNGNTTTAAMADPRTALSNVYLDGGFNVNSTSKAAWKALLASTVGIRDPGAGTADKAGYNRITQANTSFRTIDDSCTAGSSISHENDARMLDEKSLDLLAEQIVQQVKLRGPFPTLSAFVNRSIDRTAHDRAGLTENQVCNQGALQAALDGTDDKSDINKKISRSDWVNPSAIVAAWKDTSKIGHVFPEAAEGARGYGSPLYLMPSDILAKIGPFLTVRSDTFKVVAYGESRDVAGKVLARVRCEAIVQRAPQWIGNQLLATDKPQPNSPEERFGRTLHIVSFRWLNTQES